MLNAEMIILDVLKQQIKLYEACLLTVLCSGSGISQIWYLFHEVISAMFIFIALSSVNNEI